MKTNLFFDHIRMHLDQDQRLTQPQVSGMTDILKALVASHVGLNFAAYILATAWHETGKVMQPVSENLNYDANGLLKTFRKYFSPADAVQYAHKPEAIANRAYGNRMGNGNEASGDGWTYRGRGLSQITGKDKYAEFSKILGIDLVNNPDRALERDIAVTILTIGMIHGTFTGKKLSDFCGQATPNYVAARAIINGKDRADDVAAFARSFQAALIAGAYDGLTL